MKQNKKKTVAGILAAVIFGLVALLCLPVIGICVWNSVDGSQNFTMPELFRLMWIWWDYCMMPLTAVAFFIVALVLSKTKRHSKLLAVSGGLGTVWVAVGLILGVAYAISVYCQGWSFNTPVLFVVGRILEVLPLGLFAFITLFSLARVKGIAIPVVGTLLSVVAAIGEFGMSVILVIDVIKGVQQGYVDLISFLRFYSVDLVLAVLSVAFYVGILLLLFAFVYTPRKKEPSEEEPGEIEGFAIVIS